MRQLVAFLLVGQTSTDPGGAVVRSEFLSDRAPFASAHASTIVEGPASDDGGRLWDAVTLTGPPNPDAGTDAVSLLDGRHLLVYNHTAQGRSPLNVAVSRDGAAWQAALVLESQPGEYSNPAVIQTADGRAHVTYTWKRQRIRHVVLDPARLAGIPISDGLWPGQPR